MRRGQRATRKPDSSGTGSSSSTRTSVTSAAGANRSTGVQQPIARFFRRTWAGFARLFARFKQEREAKPGSDRLTLPDFIRTHPAGESRITRAREATQDGAPAMSAEEWASIKAMCGD